MTADPSLRRAGGIGSGAAGRQPDSLADVLERVLDKGIVIAGDVVVNILDIELLTLKLRLFISSAETAREMGMDWWTRDPFFSGRPAVESGDDDVPALRQRVAELEELVRRAGLDDGGGPDRGQDGKGDRPGRRAELGGDGGRR
jgi:hypothetical protein